MYAAPIWPHIPLDAAPVKARPVLDPALGRRALAEKRAEWAKLTTLRQNFADAEHMRQVLVNAGIRVPYRGEPAFTGRVKGLLRQAGVRRLDVERAVGTNVAGFLQKNPNLPLWAAVALILEATGQYTPEPDA
jgi:hypothetical protein